MLLLVLVIFVLSNRNQVDIAVWPFGLVGSVPLGLMIVAVLGLGVLLGLTIHLPRRLAAGRRAKRAEKRAAELEARAALPSP